MIVKRIAMYETQTRSRVEIRATDRGKVMLAIDGELYTLTPLDSLELARVLNDAATEVGLMRSEVYRARDYAVIVPETGPEPEVA